MSRVFEVLGRLLRGVRLFEFVALMLLLGMVLAVYLVKASAGRERGEIVAVQAQIEDQARRIRLLKAEVAGLEQPDRLERLATALDLGPVPSKHQGEPGDLPELMRAASASQKSDHRAAAPSRSTQSGFEAPPAPVVIASAAAKSGAQQ